MSFPIKSGDISVMALIITLPTVTVSTLATFVFDQFKSDSEGQDLLTVIDFTLTSFPLTIAVALIVLFFMIDNLNAWGALFIIFGACMLANLLGLAIQQVHRTENIDEMWADSNKYSSGLNVVYGFIGRIVFSWWRDFGPLMFIQSVLIGGFLGYRVGKRTLEASKFDHVTSDQTPPVQTFDAPASAPPSPEPPKTKSTGRKKPNPKKKPRPPKK